MEGRPPIEATFVTFALVLRAELESIPELKRAIERLGARIVFQKMGAGRLYITSEPPQGLGGTP